MGFLRYRAIWISDTHLGAREAKSDWLYHFLQHIETEYLYLVGDIVDMWKMKKGQWYWPDTNTKIIEDIMEKSRTGANVIYIPGNHDYGIRKYTDWQFGKINVTRQAMHKCLNGKRLLITHGDEFDAVVMNKHWTTDVGNHAYDIILLANCWFNEFRARFGLGYWSLSSHIKSRIRLAQKYIKRYEDTVINAAAARDYDGVVCGHIHHPNLRVSRDVQYINTGDWVEHCTAVCETWRGEIQLLNWTRDAAELLGADRVNNRFPRAA